VARVESELAHAESTLPEPKRFRELAARRAGFAQVLERGGRRKMIGGERALADIEHPAPQLLRGIVAAEGPAYRGETREDCRNFRVLFALHALDRIKAKKQRLGEGRGRLLQVKPRKIVEQYDEVGVIGAEVPLADCKRPCQERFGLFRHSSRNANGAEAGERWHESDVVGADRVLSDIQGATEECFGFGLRAVRLLQFPELDERDGKEQLRIGEPFGDLDRGAERLLRTSAITPGDCEPR
jgi:hypothetical protein